MEMGVPGGQKWERGGEGLIIFGCKNQPVVGLKDDVKIVLKKGTHVKLVNSHEDYEIPI